MIWQLKDFHNLSTTLNWRNASKGSRGKTLWDLSPAWPHEVEVPRSSCTKTLMERRSCVSIRLSFASLEKARLIQMMIKTIGGGERLISLACQALKTQEIIIKHSKRKREDANHAAIARKAMLRSERWLARSVRKTWNHDPTCYRDSNREIRQLMIFLL